MGEYTAIVGGPTGAHQDYAQHCPGVFSNMFANLYTPIWDGGANGTPYNDNNYFAAYMYKVVSQYKGKVRFWEIWNEPGLDLTGQLGWRDQNYPGNWWLEGPNPCDNILHAPIYQYARTLRIAWEIVKTLDPDSYVCLGSVGYQSFLNALLRNTDNPNGGDVSPDYPLMAGAYFDCISFHSYPHFDGSTTNYDANFFERHSDEAADGVVKYRDYYQVILDQYGYDGVTYPKKQWIVTEINSPRQAYTGPFFAGADAQINHIMKAQMIAKVNKIHQLHTYELFDQKTEAEANYEFHRMGLYKKIDGQPAYAQVVNDEGKALKTMTDLIYNTEYDAARTAAMNISGGARGFAWKRPDGSYIYALWAKTTEDLSETAFASYSFPASFNIGGLVKYTWDYGYTNATQVVSPQNIQLDARPVFFTVSATPPGCQLNAVANSVRCANNNTNNNPNDDIYNFSLLVNGSNSSGSWKAVINGQNVTGIVGTPLSVGPFQIAAGPLTISIQDAVNAACTTSLQVQPPAPCSNANPATYCTSKSDFPWHDWIGRVQTGTINNASDKSLYTDYTAQSTTLTAGIAQPIALTTGFSWATFDEYWRVWIDFNKNGVFETSEIALTGIQPAPALGTPQTTFNGSLLIPANAAPGLTRMRVSMKRGAFADPCETLPFGEVEDYSINVLPGAPCAQSVTVQSLECSNNGTPNNSLDDTYTFSLGVGNSGAGTGWSATVNGSTVTGNYNAAKTFGPFLISGGNLNFNVSDQGNAACQTNVAVTAPAPCSNGGGSINYCSSVSNFPWHDWIARVQVGAINNPSDKSPYSNFTALSTDLVRGQATNIALTTGYSWDTYDEYWRVWIDYNQNGVFEEPGELAFSGIRTKPATGTPTAQLDGSLTVPQSALMGATRMRVSMKRGAFPTSCETLPFGETEDYTVQIKPQMMLNPGSVATKPIKTGVGFFEAARQNDGIHLNWQTENDAEMRAYDIQRSSDGRQWETLEIVSVRSNKHQTPAYETIDPTPSEGDNYYRISALTIHNTTIPSAVRRLRLQFPTTLGVYPNPAWDQATIDLAGFAGRASLLMIYNAQGVRVQEISLDADAPDTYNLSLAGYAPGQYFLQFQAAGCKPVTGKLTVMR
ncbi:MAG: GEVED domain-containing protein [Bacteroidota bacterium]